jgi:hypothetical protein
VQSQRIGDAEVDLVVSGRELLFDFRAGVGGTDALGERPPLRGRNAALGEDDALRAKQVRGPRPVDGFVIARVEESVLGN